MVDPVLSHRKANFVQASSISSWDQEMPQTDSNKHIDIFHASFLGKKGGCKKLVIKNNDFFFRALAENRAEIGTAVGQRVQMCFWPPSRCYFQFGIVLLLQQPNGTSQRHSIARVK